MQSTELTRGIPPVPEDPIVDLCENSASSLPPEEQWWQWMSWYPQKPKCSCSDFFFQVHSHLGNGHSKHWTSCMPSCWSRNTAYFGNKTPTWCLLHKKVAPNSYMFIGPMLSPASKSSSGNAWVIWSNQRVRGKDFTTRIPMMQRATVQQVQSCSITCQCTIFHNVPMSVANLLYSMYYTWHNRRNAVVFQIMSGGRHPSLGTPTVLEVYRKRPKVLLVGTVPKRNG